MLTVACFFLHEYTPNVIWPVRWLVMLVNVFCLIALCLGRLHYTVDVIISYLMCTLIFSCVKQVMMVR